jgi:hypothetical protein
MPASTANGAAEKYFEEYKNSLNQTNHLRTQLAHAENQSEELLRKFLEAAQGNHSQWELRIVEENRTVTHAHLTPEVSNIVLAILASVSRIPAGDAFICPDKLGCASTGQLGQRCTYVCKTVQLQK